MASSKIPRVIVDKIISDGTQMRLAIRLDAFGNADFRRSTKNNFNFEIYILGSHSNLFLKSRLLYNK